ncbi:MAG: protein kinase, partial [bacterium]
EACAGDARLRAEVEALVRSCDSASDSPSFLATPAARFAEPLLEATLRASLTERYVVEREVGRGGMARVYLALDRRHNRRVAIKLLNPELGAMLGADRFLAEIAVTASLQHPNLLPLFDSGEAEGLLYYVMPFVEGESLRVRLRREHQLPVDEAVRIAMLIAGALDYAHRRGVVHRDLKPENILLQEGEPLVADFGIALALSTAGAERLTEAGVPLGTPSYMSPEQAAGDRALDARSDVYSLACVLYEMLAGDPPHTGGSVQTVMRKVISETALPVRVLRPSVSLPVESALERALAKLPADRFATARDFAGALAEGASGRVVAATRALAPATIAPPRARLRDPLVVALGGIAVVGCAVAGWLFSRGSDATPQRTTRFVVGALTTAPVNGTPTITPDGRYLVYAGSAQTGRQLFVRGFDQLEARALPGVDDAVTALMSPDGRWIGYFTIDDKLKKVPFEGGPSELVGPAFRFSHARWSSNGRIVLDAYGSSGLTWLPADGGALRQLTQADSLKGELSHVAPMVMPDGRSVIFTTQHRRGGPAPVMGELAVASMDTSATTPAPHTLLRLPGRVAITFVDGWLLYTALDGGTINAVRYDPVARTTSGTPVPVLRESDGLIDGAALGSDGTLVYTRRNAMNTPLIAAADSSIQPLLGHAQGTFMNPRFSPDGTRVLMADQSPEGSDIWMYDVASHTSTRLTSSGNAALPTWSPDGRSVLFQSSRSGHAAFWSQSVDGASPPEKVIELGGLFYGEFAPNGHTLVFQREAGEGWEIWTSEARVPGSARRLIVDHANDYMPTVARDGRWLAYVSSASGREEVYVRAFPGPGAPVQISEDGGKEPVWSHDSRRLFYRGSRQIISAQLATTGGLVAVTSRTRLLADDFDGGMPHTNFDVTPDGRLLVLGPTASRGSETIVVVNWLAELRRTLRASR